MLNKERASALGVATLAALFAAACTEFATPAELAKPQVLAISAEPPSIAPGATTELRILVADNDGPMDDLDVTWTVTSLIPGAPPLGEITSAEAGVATYTAPADIPENPTFSSVQASVQLEGQSQPLIAIKGVALGSLPLVNPTLASFTVGDQDALASPVMTLQRGETLPIAITTEPAPGETGAVAWYVTIGTIEAYQSSPTELVVGDESGSGWLFVVVRDGFGGVAWHQVQIEVE